MEFDALYCLYAKEANTLLSQMIVPSFWKDNPSTSWSIFLSMALGLLKRMDAVSDLLVGV